MSDLKYPHARQIRIRPVTLENKPAAEERKPEASQLQQDIARLQQELRELQKEKEQTMQETAAWVEREKTNWYKEKQQWIEQAKASGYKEGWQAGEKAGAAKYDSLIEKMNELSDAAQKDYLSTIAQSDSSIMEIAIAAAGKIMRHQLQNDPSAFQEIVRACIEDAGNADVITILVHPDQYETLLHQKYELQNLLDENARLSIKVNKEIPEYGCILEHPLGQIDAGVDSQLSQIRQALEEIKNG